MSDGSTETAVRLLAEAQRICVSTGAGMSAESGIETFRDEDGLWSKFNPEELATPEAFERDPVKVWEWYRLRREGLASVAPHIGHRLLAEWETRGVNLTVVTQNIDGLHHRAGSRRVIELHGRLDSVRCTACDYSQRGLDDLGAEPRCPDCGERVRPDVVWFGETLPVAALTSAFDVVENCDLLVLIGTSGVVYPAAGFPELAHRSGARLIEINPNPTPHSSLADARIRAACGTALMDLERAWQALGC